MRTLSGVYGFKNNKVYSLHLDGKSVSGYDIISDKLVSEDFNFDNQREIGQLEERLKSKSTRIWNRDIDDAISHIRKSVSILEKFGIESKSLTDFIAYLREEFYGEWN